MNPSDEDHNSKFLNWGSLNPWIRRSIIFVVYCLIAFICNLFGQDKQEPFFFIGSMMTILPLMLIGGDFLMIYMAGVTFGWLWLGGTLSDKLKRKYSEHNSFITLSILCIYVTSALLVYRLMLPVGWLMEDDRINAIIDFFLMRDKQ